MVVSISSEGFFNSLGLNSFKLFLIAERTSSILRDVLLTQCLEDVGWEIGKWSCEAVYFWEADL